MSSRRSGRQQRNSLILRTTSMRCLKANLIDESALDLIPAVFSPNVCVVVMRELASRRPIRMLPIVSGRLKKKLPGCRSCDYADACDW